MNPASESNPIRHTLRIKGQMRQIINNLREDVEKVTEPKGQALFETSAEVITGLVKAFDDYEKKSDAAWRTETITSCPKTKTRGLQDDTSRRADTRKLKTAAGKRVAPSGKKTR